MGVQRLEGALPLRGVQHQGGRVPPPDPRTVATWSSRLPHEHFDDEDD